MRFKELILEKLKGKSYDFHSTQLEFNPTDTKNLQQSFLYIDKKDLEDFGLTKDTHLTIRYGIKNYDFDQLKSLKLSGQVPIKIKDISYFETPNGDCLIFKVDPSKNLKLLRAEIEDNSEVAPDTFPKWIPHITIGWVQKGKGQKYVDILKKEFKLPIQFTSKELILSRADDVKEKISES